MATTRATRAQPYRVSVRCISVVSCGDDRGRTGTPGGQEGQLIRILSIYSLNYRPTGTINDLPYK